jgi:hypothetical protein
MRLYTIPSPFDVPFQRNHLCKGQAADLLLPHMFLRQADKERLLTGRTASNICLMFRMTTMHIVKILAIDSPGSSCSYKI